MSIFAENTLADFKIFFIEEISLEGDWRVALSELMFPSRINQVNSNRIIKYSFEGNKSHQRNIPTVAVSKPYEGETVLIIAGSYEKLEHLIKAIKTVTGLTKFSLQHNKITGVLVLFFGNYEWITFPDEEIPSILGFGGIKDGSGTHIGYKMIDTFDNLAMGDGEAKTFVADYPFDLLARKQLIFVYSNILSINTLETQKLRWFVSLIQKNAWKVVALVKLNLRIE